MRNLFAVSFLILTLAFAGCRQAELAETKNTDNNGFINGRIFTPQKIRFTQLTEFEENWKIVAYVDVMDQFSSRIKAAGIWRFELFTFEPRSGIPKGRRIYLWDDIPLTGPQANNQNWQDFMRSYKFTLEMDIERGPGQYILTATCLTSQGKRLSDSVKLRL